MDPLFFCMSQALQTTGVGFAEDVPVQVRAVFTLATWGRYQVEHTFQVSDVYPPPHLGQVNEAEEERLRGEREHQRVTRLCQQAEARVQALQKTLRRAIGKSRPYFELKAQFSQILEVAVWERRKRNGQVGVQDGGSHRKGGQVEGMLVCFFGPDGLGKASARLASSEQWHMCLE
jgi:hypothetical protein